MRDDTGVAVFRRDVADFGACRGGLAEVERALGPVDVLVNYAGITADAALHKMSEVQWRDVIRTNLGSMFNMSRQVVGGTRDRRFGRIVNISSVNGRKGAGGPVQLRRRQGRHPRLHQGAGAGKRGAAPNAQAARECAFRPAPCGSRRPGTVRASGHGRSSP